MTDYEAKPEIFMYVKWHYGKGLGEIFGTVGNLLWFILHFFSFSLAWRTLFDPWDIGKALRESGDDVGMHSVPRMMLRIFGFASKIFVIFVGIASYILVLVVSSLFVLIWILAPAVLLGSIVLAITFLNL